MGVFAVADDTTAGDRYADLNTVALLSGVRGLPEGAAVLSGHDASSMRSVAETASRKARHPAGETYRRGPWGFLPSRTARPPVEVGATSTHSPCDVEYEDFRKGPMNSGVTMHRPCFSVVRAE